MAKVKRVWQPSPMDKRISAMLRRAVERIEERKAMSRPSDPLSLRVFGVFDPKSARVVCAFPTQYYARQFVNNSKRALFIYCFDFAQPLPTSLY